jgi:PAS domain S-box-containing protein
MGVDSTGVESRTRIADAAVIEGPTAERVQGRLARVAAGAATVAATGGLAGAARKCGIPTAVVVPRGTALALVLAAVVLAVLLRGGRWTVRAGAVTLAILAAAAWPAHMTSSAALAFGLMSITLLLLAAERPKGRATVVAASAALGATALGAMALAANVLGIPEAYGWALHSRMGEHAAALTCVLGAGALAAVIRAGSMHGIPARRWLPALATTTMAGGTLVMWQAMMEHDRRGAEAAVREQAVAMAGELGRRSVDRGLLLDRLTGRWANERALDLDAWDYSTREWVRDYAGMQGLGWADTTATQRWSAPARTTAFIAHGMRLDLDARSADAVQQAAERLVTRASAPARDSSGRPILLLIAPVVRGGRLTGYLSSGLDAGAFIRDVFEEDVLRGYAFAVHDGATLLYERVRAHPADAARWRADVPMHALGRDWVLTVMPTTEILARVSSPVPTVLLIGGLLCAALVGWIVLVAQRSRELSGKLATLLHDFARENAARQESEQMRAALVHSILDGVAAFDASGCVSAWNPRMTALTGRAEAEVDGQMVGEMVTFLPEGAEVGYLLDALEGRPTLMADVRTTHSATGEEIWLDVSVTPMRSADGRTLGGLLVARDITERKRLGDVVLAGKHAAEEANRAKSDFLARMSHELRTPLNAVIGFTNVLRRNRYGRLERDELTFLDRISANGKHLLGLINEVLDLAKIESGRETAERRPTSIAALVRETVAQLDVRASGASVRLEARLPAQMRDAWTDGAKLKQVLINLIGNAIKFTPASGTVTVCVHVDAISGWPARIDVADTGIGIPLERLDAIFEAFEQGDTETTRRFGGTGLGLAISRHLCNLLGYDLVVRSEVGAGSTFSIVIPPTPLEQAAA